MADEELKGLIFEFVRQAKDREVSVHTAYKRIFALLVSARHAVVEGIADSFIKERDDWVRAAGLAATAAKEPGCSCYGDDASNSHGSGCPRSIAARIRRYHP